jgi:hypothetical protein
MNLIVLIALGIDATHELESFFISLLVTLHFAVFVLGNLFLSSKLIEVLVEDGALPVDIWIGSF